jgi:hypothetical protein
LLFSLGFRPSFLSFLFFFFSHSCKRNQAELLANRCSCCYSMLTAKG